MKCRACDTTKLDQIGQWWHLKDYFGLSGTFCPDCYDKVSHDSYRKPNRPNDYLLLLLKLSEAK